jgi:hypothetical protein
MIDGTKRIEIENVEVLDASGRLMRCRCGDRIVGVPPLRILPGTEVRWTGDRGRLVLPLEVAVNLGLADASVVIRPPSRWSS